MSDTQDSHEALLASIRQAAQLERDRVLAEAQAEVDKILAQADAEVAAIEADAQRRARQSVAFEINRTRGLVEAKTRRLCEKTKQKLLDEAFSRAQGELTTRCKARSALRKQLLAEALAELGPDARGAVDTVIATAAQGRRRIDNSPATRLTRVHALYRHDIAAFLFGASDRE
jgi:vacuolar-type H+-ATPase subunit E/Vma4